MAAAGLAVENAKGECNFGQHEINFKFDRALTTADGHAIYKNGAKEIAAQEGYSISFMPKFDEREGNSCHIHLSLRGEDGTPVFADGHGFSKTFESFHSGPARLPARVHAVLRPEHKLLQALRRRLLRPNSRSLGQGQPYLLDARRRPRSSLRVENRLPGGDVNPYLAIAAMIAAGLHGMDNELPLEDEMAGNAYEADKPHVPTNLEKRGSSSRTARRPERRSARKSSSTT